MTGLTLQSILAAAFDQSSGEGVVLLSGKGKSGVVRFDGLGQPVGRAFQS